MGRISKNPEERRNELLDAAKALFAEIGYNRAAVSDIVKKISVAQGTFYYYFKSKEDIFVAIFFRDIEEFLIEISHRIDKINGTTLEKLKEFIRLDFQDKIDSKDKSLVNDLHDEQNAGLHHKVIKATIQSYKPLLSNIINQGIATGEFKTDYPEEIAEFYLTNLNFGLDPGVFSWTDEEYVKKSEALMNSLEKSLNLPSGSLNIQELLKA